MKKAKEEIEKEEIEKEEIHIKLYGERKVWTRAVKGLPNLVLGTYFFDEDH